MSNKDVLICSCCPEGKGLYNAFKDAGLALDRILMGGFVDSIPEASEGIRNAYDALISHQLDCPHVPKGDRGWKLTGV